ncbi:KAP family P-loop NTPase fold protein [Rhizobium leguminosarum]|uniref:KAP family P-loop NTPase fold protein n=1 Tax=Rhizobium leguminosarum TaxID=384 RepID=UPI00102F99BE|nr:P-loop NTPase fold protein [Rhizobium leguminosarum]TAY13849.1 NTPase KAP [Rhizobium leguminosarum]
MPHIGLDTDRPLSDETSDKFGFVGIAERLAPNILDAVDGDGLVIGIEGPWGSGKTTLMNFLETELQKLKDDHIHLIKIAPWLNGDVSNLVRSLLDRIAEVIEKAEEAEPAQRRNVWRKAKTKGGELGSLVRSYGVKTGRVLAPAARFAEYFLPGAKIGADALELGSAYLEKTGRNPTTAEIKAKISEKLATLNIGFVVILDDLDRLEPSQAVEVVRLVRSVADFPGLVYILCYDRDVLAHALQVGLSVPDGDIFLQKIVQLTFSIPLPEPFDLRHSFLKEAVAIYKEVNGTDPDEDLYSEVRSSVDREGAGLRTPREVKLALNGVRFSYAGIRGDVFFPDLCRLNLLKITNMPLYRWLEEYLGTRSVVVTGDGMVTDEEKHQMGVRLLALLPSADATSTRSIWNLRQFVPGVVKTDIPSKSVFETATQNETSQAITQKRLGSPIHYRFYFALTSPKTVMTDADFNQLLGLAAQNFGHLRARFVELSQERRASGLSWMEHVLDRLDAAMVAKLSVSQIVGLIKAISEAADSISSLNKEARPFTVSIEAQAEHVVVDCLWRLKKMDAEGFNDVAIWLAKDCTSMSWLVGKFFRTKLADHGVLGDRSQHPDSRLFSDELFAKLLSTLKKRTAASSTKASIRNMPRVAAYVWGWSELSTKETVRRWVAGFIKNDDNFLFFLEALRSWSMSDKVYYPLQKDAVIAWLPWERTIARLEALKAKGESKADEVLEAIRIGR